MARATIYSSSACRRESAAEAVLPSIRPAFSSSRAPTVSCVLSRSGLSGGIILCKLRSVYVQGTGKNGQKKGLIAA